MQKKRPPPGGAGASVAVSRRYGRTLRCGGRVHRQPALQASGGPLRSREERESCCRKLHCQSRTGCHWPTMEPSVKPFSVSLIRREPRSSEARWREADWNGEAENGSEATLCRPGAPRPAATSNVFGGRVTAIRPYSS